MQKCAVTTAVGFACGVVVGLVAAGRPTAPTRSAEPTVIRTAPGRGPEVHTGRLLWTSDGRRYGEPTQGETVWEVSAPGSGSFAFVE